MSKRYWKLRVEDIIICTERINIYVDNMNYEDFTSDQKTIDAVVRNLEIIGEASKNIPTEIIRKFDNINWEGIIGLRNRIAHVYFGLDLKIIWRITQDEVPILQKQMTEILSSSAES